MFDFGDDGFWDLETEDFALIGGLIGYAEEECEERMRLERELEAEEAKEETEEPPSSCCSISDEPPDGFFESLLEEDDEEPYP